MALDGGMSLLTLQVQRAGVIEDREQETIEEREKIR